MMGSISLCDLRIRCIVGVYPHERQLEQDVYLDVRMDLDFAAAAQSEDVSRSVDYAAVAAQLQELIVAEKFYLIETMAERCASFLLGAWPELSRVAIAVKKPAAVPQAANVMVSVERTR
jgi:dihydroneopterin aldolase